MRDENGFKCHVASESHVRNMMTIGEDPRKAINEFSNEFKRDFVQLLRTGHGEKQVNANHFYQEYISNKQHVHMNATKWNSLTEFCKYLGREGICRVEIDEKNEERGGASALMISWIDNSPEAMRRQEALKKRERQDRGDEHREQRLIEQQIRRAREAAGQKEPVSEDDLTIEAEEDQAVTEGIRRLDGEKIKLNFGAKKTESEKPPSPPLTDKSPSDDGNATEKDLAQGTNQPVVNSSKSQPPAQMPSKLSIKPMSLGTSKPKNVFAVVAKKNAFSDGKKAPLLQHQKPMSEAERIMKEELERKRLRDERGHQAVKKQRVS